MKKYSVTIRATGYRKGDYSANCHAFKVEADTPVQAMKMALHLYPSKAEKKVDAVWEEDWITPLPDEVDQVKAVASIVGLVIETPVEIM